MVGVSGKTVTRRRAMVWTAKAGSAVAVGAWVAPKFTSIASAEEGTGTGTGTEDPQGTGTGTGTAGSPCPNPDNPDCPDTSSTTSRPNVRFVGCDVQPGEIAPGGSVEVSGQGYKASSNVEVRLIGIGKLGDAAVQPNGTFARSFVVASSVPVGEYRVEVRGHNENGKEERCFSNLRVLTNGTSGGTTTTTDGSGSSGSGGTNNGAGSSGSGSDDGPLPFTGSDTTNLVALGAGALILGRLLYEVRERLAERDGASPTT